LVLITSKELVDVIVEFGMDLHDDRIEHTSTLQSELARGVV
jgi:hypothetical protein